MQFFIIGTDTNIGKTVVSSWICLHTNYDYLKLIQTGSNEGTDSQTVAMLTNSKIHKEIYSYKEPLSPHLAAKIEYDEIVLPSLTVPKCTNLLIEGVGGLLVPINRKYLFIDVLQYLSLPVIVVASSRIGTINHTLLTLQALREKSITILGIIVTGKTNQDNCEAIEWYGKTTILAQLPFLPNINKIELAHIHLPQKMQQLLGV